MCYQKVGEKDKAEADLLKANEMASWNNTQVIEGLQQLKNEDHAEIQDSKLPDPAEFILDLDLFNQKIELIKPVEE